jgi:hypothetical protein
MHLTMNTPTKLPKFQRLSVNEYLDHPNKEGVDTENSTGHTPARARAFRHSGECSQSMSFCEVTNGVSAVPMARNALARSIPHGRMLHLARILNPLTESLRPVIQSFDYRYFNTCACVLYLRIRTGTVHDVLNYANTKGDLLFSSLSMAQRVVHLIQC